MKANELRLGNYINDGYVIAEIDSSGCGLVDVNEPDDLASYIYLENESLVPIPLTEECLLKFGFKKTKSQMFEYDDVFVIETEKYSWIIEVKLGDYPDTNPNCGCVSLRHEEEETSGIPKDLYDKEIWTEEDQKRCDNYTEIYESWTQPIAYYINKVHQLQNLYFCLCGTELKIKE